MADQPQQWTEEQKRQYYERYRQQYPQYYQNQPPQASPPQQQPQQRAPKKRDKLLTAFILIFAFALAIFLYVLVAKMGEKEVQLAPDEVKIDVNGVVISDANITSRPNSYYVDEDVFIYTKFSNFKNIIEDGMYNIRLTYGVQVFDRNGNIINSISNNEMSDVDDLFEYPVTDYYFTAKISTLNLEPGEYKIISRVTDNLTGLSQSAEQRITLSYPTTIRVAGPYFGEAAGNVFRYGDSIYNKGEQIQGLVQLRGFRSEGTTVSIDVNLEVYDAEGYLQPQLSNYNIYNLKQMDSPDQKALSFTIYANTTGVNPGVYWFKITAKDLLTGMTHSNIKPVIVK